MKDEASPPFEALQEDEDTEVCVVGAGIAGLMTAYLLINEGHSVTVLEAGVVAGGETARTTAHLSFALDERYYELENLFGESGSRLAFESHARAIGLIEDIVNRHHIDCDFTRLDGYLFTPPAESQQELEREFPAASRAGVKLNWVEKLPIEGIESGPCLRFPNQGQFHPLRFLTGLAATVASMGGRIYTKTRVTKVVGGTRPYVEARGHVVHADAVVLATNTPINDNLTIHTRQSPYRTYVVGAAIPWGSVPRALYWDTMDPYHYIRLKSSFDAAGHEKHDVLIVGGEDHRQGGSEDEKQHLDRLERWTRERFPVEDIVYRWSGMVLESADGLGLIGRDNSERNVFIATGDSGQGMTHGAIAGLLLTDLILGRRNPWEKLYDPSRITSRAASEYLKDTAAIASGFAEWVTPGDLSSEQDIAPGAGAVIRSGLEKQAVYRDSYGSFFRCSAVCPHLGCIVAWNTAEESWDCPCHGSRFDCKGKILRGPATRDLEPVE